MKARGLTGSYLGSVDQILDARGDAPKERCSVCYALQTALPHPLPEASGPPLCHRCATVGPWSPTEKCLQALHQDAAQGLYYPRCYEGTGILPSLNLVGVIRWLLLRLLAFCRRATRFVLLTGLLRAAGILLLRSVVLNMGKMHNI